MSDDKIEIEKDKEGVVGISKYNTNTSGTYLNVMSYNRCEIKYMGLRYDTCIQIRTYENDKIDLIFDNNDDRNKWYVKYFKPEYDENKLENKIDSLDSKINNLTSELQEIKNMIKYMPGGIGYVEAKEDFEEKQKN